MKILIVDDHPIVHGGLKRLLGPGSDIEFREAATAKEALGLFRSERPGLVIMDLNLPGTGGLDLIRRLKIEDSKTRILVFSVHADIIHVARAIEAGASGYVTKNAAPEQIAEAVFRVAEGQNYIEHALAQELALRKIDAPADPLQGLSRRDLEILRLLAQGRSLQEIADSIAVSYKTVANNCSQIKAKLGLARTADLVRVAIENGIAAGTE